MYKNFAEVYDIFMEHCDYREWRQQVEAISKKYKKERDTLLEIGCGTGNMLLQMADRYSCVGLDISKDMLNVAKDKLKGKNISLYEKNMINFDLNEKFDIIISIFDTITHIINTNDLIEHFNSIKKHLNKDGIYIFDTVDRKFMEEMFPGGSFTDVRENLAVIWEHEVYKGIDYIDAVYFVEDKDGLYKRYEEGYEKKIFTSDEIEAALKKAGLKFLERVENDKIAGRRYFYAITLN